MNHHSLNRFLNGTLSLNRISSRFFCCFVFWTISSTSIFKPELEFSIRFCERFCLRSSKSIPRYCYVGNKAVPGFLSSHSSWWCTPVPGLTRTDSKWDRRMHLQLPLMFNCQCVKSFASRPDTPASVLTPCVGLYRSLF